jgi:TusA-related sulfurtransferase
MKNIDKTVKILDCSKLCCSLPLIETRLQLEKMKTGEKLEVIATCSATEKDIEILTSLEQFELVQKWKEDERVHFLIKKVI